MNNNKNPKVGWHIGSNPKSLPIYKSHQTTNQDFMFDEMISSHWQGWQLFDDETPCALRRPKAEKFWMFDLLCASKLSPCFGINSKDVLILTKEKANQTQHESSGFVCLLNCLIFCFPEIFCQWLAGLSVAQGSNCIPSELPLWKPRWQWKNSNLKMYLLV